MMSRLRSALRRSGTWVAGCAVLTVAVGVGTAVITTSGSTHPKRGKPNPDPLDKVVSVVTYIPSLNSLGAAELKSLGLGSWRTVNGTPDGRYRPENCGDTARNIFLMQTCDFTPERSEGEVLFVNIDGQLHDVPDAADVDFSGKVLDRATPVYGIGEKAAAYMPAAALVSLPGSNGSLYVNGVGVTFAYQRAIFDITLYGSSFGVASHEKPSPVSAAAFARGEAELKGLAQRFVTELPLENVRLRDLGQPLNSNPPQ